MTATLTFFAHDGVVGAVADLEDGIFANDIHGKGQLGIVVLVEHCAISEEAKAILKGSKREGGSFASLMLTEHNDGKASVGLLGFGKYLVEPVIGRLCQLSVLEKITVIPNNPPRDFIEFVNKKHAT